MKLFRGLLVAIIAAFASACGGSQTNSEISTESSEERARVLIFSHSTGWRHDSIETGVAALSALAEREGYAVEASEDPDVFTNENLERIDAVILLNTTSKSEDGGEWFDGARGAAFQNFVRNGGAVVGIHAATDSHRGWPWYGRMIGGYFDHHPEGTPTGMLSVVDSSHPSTRGMPGEFSRTDEWYYIADFNRDVDVLVTLDPTSIGQEDIGPLPISWRHEFEGGRVFYTSMGHTAETYSEPVFLDHVAGGLRWALGRED